MADDTVTLADAAVADAATTTIASSADAMRRDELFRTQRLAWTGMLLPAAAAMTIPLLGGDPIARAVLIASLGALALANLYLLYISRDPARWSDTRLAGVWVVAVIAVLGITYFFGALSGVLIAPILGIYFAGLGQSRVIALLAYGMFAVGHATLLVLTVSGAIADRGLLRADEISKEVQLVAGVLIQMVLFAGFMLARASRKTTMETVMDLERAIRVIAHREALLQEARQDFERALRIGGAGRHTDQVIGSFRLGVVIGRGAMGEVYDAVGTRGGEPAAVKMLHLEAVAHPGALERFRREAQVAAAVTSPHLCKVLEVGGDAAPLPYLAMERLVGVDLAGHLRERGRLDLDETIEMTRQLAAGLEAARKAGIVHRDLKPQNVFRCPAHPERGGGAAESKDGPTWKILDFGVSKLAGHGGTLTQGHVVGTPQYMAPEQARGEEVDHRADVYALAAIVYRCLTGRPPFAGAGVPQLLYAVVHTLPPRPSSLAELPPGADDVLARGLAKRPGDRFQDAAAFAAALARLR